MTNAAGKTIDGTWSYDEKAVAKVREAYRILFSDHAISLIALAARVGWSSGFSLRRSLENPVWHGVRISQPMAGETEPVEIRLPLEPVLTDDEWARAQVLLQKRRTWSKETRDQRFLGAGLLVCQCGRRYYFRSDVRRGQHDAYYCASRYPRGKGCGAASLWREVVDAAIMRMVKEYMTDAEFLTMVFRRLNETPQPDTRVERERELAKLAARRKRWMDAYDEERITKREFDERMDKAAAAIRVIEVSMPLRPPPFADHRALVPSLAQTFARFRTWPFAKQRATLKRVVRSLPVTDDSFTEVAISGAFLGGLAHTKSTQPSRSRCSPPTPGPAPP
jgi:hypothetical protein